MAQSGEPFDPYYHWLGIPPDEQPPNHYRLLGIQPLEEHREVIQNAADRQMAHLRTFQSGPRAGESQQLLNEVSAARVCLLSQQKKRVYDQQLRETLSARSALARTVPPAPHPPAVTPPAASQPAVGPPDEPSEVALDLSVVTDETVPRFTKATRGVMERHPRHLPAIVAVLVCSALTLALVVTYVVWAPSSAVTGNRLVLTWPASQRAAASLEIDGRRYQLSDAPVVTDECIELDLQPGPHTYRITHPDFQPLEGTFLLDTGARLELSVAFTPRSATAHLVLQWPETERENAIVRIDGRPCDVLAEAVDIDSSQIKIPLSSGTHTVSVVRDDATLLERTLKLDAGRQITITVNRPTAQLLLRWDRAKREGATLLLDGETVHLENRSAKDNGKLLEFALPSGIHTLRIERNGATLLDNRPELAVGKRLIVNVDALIDQATPSLVLVWPAAERDGATLEIDGKRQPLTRAADTENTSDFVIDLTPGEHTIKITRPDFEVFEKTMRFVSGQLRLRVTWKRLAASLPSVEEIQRTREDFVNRYTQYEEFKHWNEESDPEKKQRQLATLVSKISSEAGSMKRASPEQFVAYDQAYRLAIAHDELLAAHGILRNMQLRGCLSESEYDQRDRAMWNEAIASAGLDALAGYLKRRSADGKRPNSEEQSRIVRRVAEAPEIEKNYRAVERIITTMHDCQALNDAAAMEAQVSVFLKASRVNQLTSDQLVELGEEMIGIIPDILKQASDAGIQHANSLIDAVAGCRRKVLADRPVPLALRARVEALNEGTKDLRDQITQFDRVAEARNAISLGAGTEAQQRLLGLWLLQQGQYEDALSCLRQSGDPALVELAAALPDTARGLSERASAIEAESKKTRYSQRYEAALLGYAQYVRQLALSKDDTTLDASLRAELEGELGGSSRQFDLRRFPKGKWSKLLDVIDLGKLREAAEKAASGQWNVLDDGTIVSMAAGPSQLVLPLAVDGSYAIRFVFRRSSGENVNVNLPLGDRSVLFTLGAFSGRYGGLQYIDGKSVSDAENTSSIERSEFYLRSNVPVPVELHVELSPASSQLTKQRKMTGSSDWTVIGILINGQPMRRVSAATSRFSMDSRYTLPPGALGLSANAIVAYSNIELMRLE